MLSKPTYPTDDIVFENRICRYYGNAQQPTIKYRTENGGWKVLDTLVDADNPKDEVDQTWDYMVENADEGRAIKKRGASLVIVDATSPSRFEPEEVTPEVLPPETQISTGSKFLPAVEVSIQKAIELAEYSKKLAKFSVLCAAQAGAEFAQIKSQCEHGEWMKVLGMLPFGKDTVYKYMKLADEMETRLQELGSGDAIDLLQLPGPAELLTGDHEDILEQINHVTGEQNLRQLYFDWGILKSPKKAGGARPADDKPATPQQLTELRRKTANELIGNLCVDVQTVCLGEKRWIIHADLDFLRILEGDLIDALKNVKTLIKSN